MSYATYTPNQIIAAGALGLDPSGIGADTVPPGDAVIGESAARTARLYAVLSMLSAPFCIYHGYRRNRSIGWALGWGVLGAIFPIITPTIALAQGFGKPKGLTPNARRRKKARKKAKRRAAPRKRRRVTFRRRAKAAPRRRAAKRRAPKRRAAPKRRKPAADMSLGAALRRAKEWARVDGEAKYVHKRGSTYQVLTRSKSGEDTIVDKEGRIYGRPR